MSKMKSKRKIIVVAVITISVIFVLYILLIAQQNNWFDVFGRDCRDVYNYGDTPGHNEKYFLGNTCDPDYGK